MTSAEIAAYIGAAAWLPIVLSWVYKFFVTPRVTIVPGEFPEIGFSTLGPIINFRIAITATRKPAVIDSIDLTLTHQDGEYREFHWTGMTEQVNQIVDAAGNRQRIEKETNPIAFLVGVESVLEKFVRFQDSSFQRDMQLPLNTIVEKVHFSNKQGSYSSAATMASPEFDHVKRGWARGFFWKAGKYTALFSVSSPSRLTLKQVNIEFQLTDTDIEILKKNLTINEESHAAILKQIEDGMPQPALQWNWRYPRTVKTRR